MSSSAVSKSDVFLVHAGGYDSRVEENVEHYKELKSLSEDLQVILQIFI